MTIRPQPGLPTVQRRSSADHDLSQLFFEVSCARAAERVARCAQRTDSTCRSDSLRIAAALGAYTTALERYGLPVPPGIRTELRLRRGLAL